jgi:hypothetical protein
MSSILTRPWENAWPLFEAWGEDSRPDAHSAAASDLLPDIEKYASALLALHIGAANAQQLRPISSPHLVDRPRLPFVPCSHTNSLNGMDLMNRICYAPYID